MSNQKQSVFEEMGWDKGEGDVAMISCFVHIVDNYRPLFSVLLEALDQAQKGKGSVRHAADRAFMDQPIMTIPKLQNSDVGLMYQAIKKLQESQRMGIDEAIAERLGAINYIAASILFLKGK